jgi:hypothetical protein
MPRDSSGNFTLTAGNPVAADTTIEPVWANSTLPDIATALSDSLSRSGLGGMLVPFKNDAGTLANPGITWAAEPTAGFYRKNPNNFWYSIAGQDIFGITSQGIQMGANKYVIGAGSIPYIPVWRSNGTVQPSYGDAIKAGRYSLTQDLCFFEFYMLLGATTIVGNGAEWFFRAPVLNLSTPGTGAAMCIDAPPSLNPIYWSSTSVIRVNEQELVVVPTGGAVANSIVPFPWQPGDLLTFSMLYTYR